MSSSSSNQKKKRRSNPKGPELFSGFGRSATDLLTKGYNKDKKFSVSTYSTETGVILTSTSERKGKTQAGNVAAQYICKDAIIDARIDVESKVSTVLTFSKPLWPSTKATASFTLPEYNSSKFKIQYYNETAALALSAPLNSSPAFKLSATICTSPDIAFGIEAVYKTSARHITQCNAGISVTQPNCNLTMVLVNNGDLVRLSYLHYLNKSKKIAAAAEISRSFSKEKSSFLLGGTWTVDHQTMVKARLSHHGKLNALLQYEIIPKSHLTISGEFNTKALDKTPKIGLGLVLRL